MSADVLRSIAFCIRQETGAVGEWLNAGSYGAVVVAGYQRARSNCMAPKTATKRVFLITDSDDPHADALTPHALLDPARNTLRDLTHACVAIEPFFISDAQNPFDTSIFYACVLLPNNLSLSSLDEDSKDFTEEERTILPESISITRIDDLLAQMRFHEVLKRAHFSIGMELGAGLVIGVKGYGLVIEQKKGAYKYFVDLDDRIEVAGVKTLYLDDDQQAEVDKSQMSGIGHAVGACWETGKSPLVGIGRGMVGALILCWAQPFFTAEDVRSFRTLGLDPTIKLLGFKDESELAFEDNVKHSFFLYPDEMAEKPGEGGWNEPPGFHLVPLPFADDIRAAPIEEACRAQEEVKEAWITKLCVKNGTYPPDSYPNPGELIPTYIAMIRKRAGGLLQEWKKALMNDESANKVIVTASKSGTKREADNGAPDESVAVSGKKADLVDHIADWIDNH
ncbi:hypothetical protein PILCRDRAFT_3721 [Piloderma croceum F 1598]|uniref:Ku domain-containing protein n=1 Tax=Piloderma croceum (strain F 1598) TaxID=765440 RepID=A0A0C3FUE4_PILCF|nr:hypothetical protein PILCRDRAFT_3721 [Piloderma croceum F 1598]